MRPGTPHFVYGPEHTICYGGHYYSTCLMQETLFSLVHNRKKDQTAVLVFHI